MYLDIYNAWLPNGTFHNLNLVENIPYGTILQGSRQGGSDGSDEPPLSEAEFFLN